MNFWRHSVPVAFLGMAFMWLMLPVMGGCKHTTEPIIAPVVAPAGPATNAVNPAITAEAAAGREVLSKIAASAGSAAEINAGQPAGPRTTGVANEAALIQSLAGEPAAVDKLAASERARVVAEGDLKKIAAAYQTANSEAEQAKTAKEGAEQRLVEAQAAAKAEQEASARKFQAVVDGIVAKANADVKAANDEASRKIRAEQTKWVTVIFFGLSALCMAGGIVVLVGISSVPMFGPKAGFGLVGASLGLAALGITINQVQDFLFEHSWVVGGGLAVVVVALAISAALIYSNHQHSKTP